jgi:DNA-binding LacI/PurR family transcriptional regulator
MSKITISDVARAAGCSKSTVSFAINRNHPISEEMRAKIQQAIEELGYRPKGVRRTQQRRCIALFIHHSERPDVGETTATFFPRNIKSRILATDVQHRNGLRENQSRHERNRQGPPGGRRHQLLPRINSIDLLKYCRGIPSVIFLRDDSMLSSITMNYHHRMTLALDHLAGFGHRNIAFIVYEGSRRRPVILKMEEASRRYRTAENEALSVRVETFWSEQDFDDEIFPLFDRIYADGVTAVITETLFFRRRPPCGGDSGAASRFRKIFRCWRWTIPTFTGCSRRP